jgi:hypothetical protein
MTDLQKIQSVAKEYGLLFVRQNSKINGACLYNFETESGNVVARNWTISSAIVEYNFGDLRAKIS